MERRAMIKASRILFFVCLVLAGCADPGSSGRVPIDQVPMYGGMDRQSVPQLKAADEQFISGVTKEFGSRQLASDVFVEYGIRLYRQDDLATAMRRLNQAWLLNPKNPDVYWGFACVLYDQGLGKMGQMKEMIDRALELGLSKPVALADVGRIYALCGEHDLSLDPAAKELYFAKSEEFFQRASASAPRDVYIHASWLDAYFRRGDYAACWRMVPKVRELGGAIPEASLKMLREKMPEPRN